MDTVQNAGRIKFNDLKDNSQMSTSIIQCVREGLEQDVIAGEANSGEMGDQSFN